VHELVDSVVGEVDRDGHDAGEAFDLAVAIQVY
jgi:hypothetical protein